jgi:hypothetical protein
VRQQQRARPGPSRSERSLGPGVTAANDDDIERRWKPHGWMKREGRE